ncbi:MAG: alpha/beta fold hydrolase [Nitriliruptoraceae bacterium]
MARRGLLAAGIGAALAGGAAVGFVAERAIVRGRLVPPTPEEEGEVALGSLAGELTRVAGPDGLDVAIETYGPRGAPQLVLSHGWICTGRVWHEVVTRLSGRYRVITYDQPGHGRTDAPSDGHYDLDLLGDALASVIATATDPGPLVLAGHSLGGMTVLNAARRHPQVRERLRGVALLSTTSSAKAERLGFELGIRTIARLERGLRRAVPTLRDPKVTSAADRLTRSSSDLSYLVARWTSVGPNADPRIVTFTQQMALSSGSDVVFGLASAVLGVDEDAGLDALAEVPTTLMVGAHDRLTPVALSQRMAERSQARLIELADVGHMSPLEAGEAVAEVLREHLEGRVSVDADPRPQARAPGAA